MTDSEFDIPVVVFLFKRVDKPLLVLERVAEVKPKKIYLLSDAGRNDEEQELVARCREKVELAIDWDCEIIRRYANENIGVYNNIAGGAKWVFEREKYAIFLEDDNLPEVSFFYFCRELLQHYENDNRVLWICGTNYLEKYEPVDGSSYMFTKNMMPCGWASWAKKFSKFYQSDLRLWKKEYVKEFIKSEYSNNKLFEQDAYNVDYEISYFEKHGRFYSWDYHMSFSIRVNGLYGVVPKFNQIKNIGVDDASIHGGNNPKDLMTDRFCNLNTYPMSFPLSHPAVVLRDSSFEEQVSHIIIDPRFFSFKTKLSRKIKSLFGIAPTESLGGYVKNRFLGK